MSQRRQSNRQWFVPIRKITAHTGKDLEQGVHSSTGSENLYSHYENQYGGSSEFCELAYVESHTNPGIISYKIT